MGLAVSACFSNTYHTLKYIGPFDLNLYAAILSQFATVVTLIVLFYLGAERMLDSRYLDIEVKEPPTRRILLFDLFSLGATAAWFVVLADTLPDRDDLDKFQTVAEYTDYIIGRQHAFLKVLLGLYIMDSFILVGQIGVVWARRRFASVEITRRALKAHLWWVLSNVLCGLLFYPFLFREPGAFSATVFTFSGMSLLSLTLFVVHIIRFVIDYVFAFDFYYPDTVLPDTDDLFLKDGRPADRA